jgi:hypothetical protein
LYSDVRNLLRSYEYAARSSKTLRFALEYVDPDRDLARARELAREYDVHEADVVLLVSGGRSRVVEAKDLRTFKVEVEDGTAVRRPKGFLGEQAFSSAIHSVAQPEQPVACFLTGHGEHSPDDHEHGGYSALARAMRRDNIDVRQLFLAGAGGVPEDCSVLIAAGADRRLSQAEVDYIGDYLDRNGRLLVLADPGVHVGLEELLADWGIRLSPAVAVGLNLTGLGRDLLVMQYGRHAVTRNLQSVATMFFRPRVIQPIKEAESVEPAQADKPRVSVLAVNTSEGWAETDPNQKPPRFDPENDTRGPVPIAVAAERGPVQGIEVELSPTRIVVIGDSYFVSNGAMEGGFGGNLSFFLSAVNWLLEREELIGIEPSEPGVLRLDINRKQMRAVWGIVVLAIPGVVVLLGIIVRLWRR